MASFHVKAPQKFPRLPRNIQTFLTTYRAKCILPEWIVLLSREGVGASIKHWWIKFLRYFRSMCRLQIFCVTCLIFPGRLSFEFRSQHKIVRYLGWRYFQPCIKNMAMRQVSSALLFITVLLIRQYFFNLPTLPSLCSQCGHQQEETRLFVDSLHRASCISVLHFLRMCPYRASLYLHSQLISYTSAKHYGDEKCSYILQDLRADASHHWWVEKPDDGKTKNK